MTDDNTGLVAASMFLGCMMGMFLASIYFISSGMSHKVLVEKGHGRYNETTAEFELVEVKK